MKILSLQQKDQSLRLYPAYDLVPTVLVNPADTEELALTLNAKKRKLQYNDFLEAYKKCGLSQKVLDNTLELFTYCKPEMFAVLDKSFVSEEFVEAYKSLVTKRYKQLGLE